MTSKIGQGQSQYNKNNKTGHPVQQFVLLFLLPQSPITIYALPTQYVLGLYLIAAHIPDDKQENTQIQPYKTKFCLHITKRC